jgi:hypothetical protein
MLTSLITILVIAVIVGLIWWVCDFLPVPEPLNRLVKILAIVIGAIAIIYALLGLVGAVPPLAIR